MSDDELPPRPGDEPDAEERTDYSDAPVHVVVKGEHFDLDYSEALALASTLSATLEVWWRMNTRG